MADNKEIKDTGTADKNAEVSSQVPGEKVKCYIIVMITLLCVLTALFVFLSPEAKEARENKSEEREVLSSEYIDT